MSALFGCRTCLGRERKKVDKYMIVLIEKIQKEEESIVCHRYRLLLQNQRIADVGKIFHLFHFPHKRKQGTMFPLLQNQYNNSIDYYLK